MKPFLQQLVRIYLCLGAVFGGTGILSYAWAAATQAECRDPGLVVMAMIYSVFWAVVRTFLWLPSLVHWWSGGSAFLQWLLPGLAVTCGTEP